MEQGILSPWRRRVDALALRPGYKWLVVALLFCAGFLNLEDRVVIFSVMPLLRQDLHMSDMFVGALMTAFLWAYAISSPFAAFFADGRSRRNVLIGCLTLWSIATVLAGFITSPAQLMTTRIFLAITEAFYVPTAWAIVADYHTPATRAKAVGALIIGMNLGPILGGRVAGWIGDHYGWRPTLFSLGSAGVVLALVLFVLLRDAPSRVAALAERRSQPRDSAATTRFRETFGYILRTPSLMIVMFSVGMFALSVWMLITWLPLFLYETFKMNLADSGFYGNFAIGGPVFVGALAGGFISDRVGAKNPARRLLLLFGFYILAVPFPLIFSQAQSWQIVLLSVFLFQLARTLGELNSHPLLFDLVPASKRSTAVGIQNSINTFLGGIGPLIVGHYKASLGFQAIFGLVPIVICLAVAALIFAYFKLLPRDLAKAARST